MPMSTMTYVTLGVAAVCLVWGISSGEVPNWQMGGALPVGAKPLAANGGRISLSPGDLVVFEGDSNTAGGRVGGEDQAFPEQFRLVSGQSLRIENRAQGGTNVVIWTPRPAQGARLVILMFGSNDAAPRGVFSDRMAVPPSTFRSRLRSAITRFREEGAQVLVLAAPPAGAKAMDERIAPYRLAARQVAESSGVMFRDPAEAFATSQSQPPLQYDALHLTKAGHRALAEWLAASILTEHEVAKL